MENKAVLVEGFLRVASIVLATMSALLLGLDTQTKTILFIPKKATAKDLQAVVSESCFLRLIVLFNEM